MKAEKSNEQYAADLLAIAATLPKPQREQLHAAANALLETSGFLRLAMDLLQDEIKVFNQLLAVQPTALPSGLPRQTH